MFYEITVNGEILRLDIKRAAEGWLCELNGRKYDLDVRMISADVLSLIWNDKAFEIRRELLAGTTQVWVNGEAFAVEVADPRSFRSRKKAAAAQSGPRRIVAPMPGKVVRVLVSESSLVEDHQGIIVIEAMKMQNEIKSPKKGKVQRIMAQAGTAVNAGDALAIIE
jgi:biotin carboxyl carrier protein